MHRAFITIESSRSGIFYDALKQETAPRANISVNKIDGALEIEISSENASNLRAALNSFLKWIDLADRIGDAVSSR